MKNQKQKKREPYGGEQITVFSDKSISFESSAVEILEYDEQTVLIGLGKLKARIYGNGFIISKITPQYVAIAGNIHSFEFEGVSG